VHLASTFAKYAKMTKKRVSTKFRMISKIQILHWFQTIEKVAIGSYLKNSEGRELLHIVLIDQKHQIPLLLWYKIVYRKFCTSVYRNRQK
jgi:hypothetical protein